jgi:hypothetical protein
MTGAKAHGAGGGALDIAEKKVSMLEKNQNFGAEDQRGE